MIKMWKNVNKLCSIFHKSLLLTPEVCLQQQLRTTFILKRRYPPMLHRKGSHPKRLKNKHYIYDLVKDTDTIKEPDLEVILLNYVEGLGDVGERVSVRPNYAYKNLLLPGLAVYATPENSAKYETVDISKKKSYSSPTVERDKALKFGTLHHVNISNFNIIYKFRDDLLLLQTDRSHFTCRGLRNIRTLGMLSRITLSVIMNKEIPWTLEPWHIRTSFRKCGYNVPESCIAIPSKPIKGPNMDIENREFFITVTINKQEKVDVRCRIHHWSTGITERLGHVHEFWKSPSDPIFPEDTEKLQSLNSELELGKVKTKSVNPN